MNSYQQRLAATVTLPTWLIEAGVSVTMGGLLMAVGTLSFPLPWTPVPFSMMPFGLLVVGAMQRPVWSALSVVIYLLAGGLGAPVYAEGSSGWQHLAGGTAGYLFGFLLVSPMVAGYASRPRRVLAGPWRIAVLGLLGVASLAGIGAIINFLATGNHLSGIDGDIAGYGVGRSVLWIVLFLVAAGTGIGLLLRGRLVGRAGEAVQMWLVMMAAMVVLHVCGIAVLMPAFGLDLLTAVVIGSLVFLPFDTLKAALAVAATLPFRPSHEEPHEH